MPFRALAAAPSCSFGIRLFDYDVYLIKIVYFVNGLYERDNIAILLFVFFFRHVDVTENFDYQIGV